MDICKLDKQKIALIVGYMLLILMTSVIPMDREIKGLNFIIGIKPLIQNSLHIPVYAILAVLWLQLLSNHGLAGIKRFWIVFLFSAGFGIMNEFIQLTIPGRYPSLIDMLFNTIGFAAGIWLYLYLEKCEPGLIRRIICE
ncbi:MAG: VanZ family protein [Thermodesulfobacteriota bacterium]|nr:VanZ family protein [Thermodesulfobacteriota bacterium]